jgi:hypothetical protein
VSALKSIVSSPLVGGIVRGHGAVRVGLKDVKLGSCVDRGLDSPSLHSGVSECRRRNNFRHGYAVLLIDCVHLPHLARCALGEEQQPDAGGERQNDGENFPLNSNPTRAGIFCPTDRRTMYVYCNEIYSFVNDYYLLIANRKIGKKGLRSMAFVWGVCRLV